MTKTRRLPAPAERQVRTSVRVRGDQQVDVFYALCAQRGLRPHQLVAELVGDAIAAADRDPAVARLLAGLAESRAARPSTSVPAVVLAGPWPGSPR